MNHSPGFLKDIQISCLVVGWVLSHTASIILRFGVWGGHSMTDSAPRSPTNKNICSRRDYWLVSQIITYVTKCETQSTPLTDHCLSLSLSLCRQQRAESIWKFNNSLLQNKDFCTQVKKIKLEIDDMMSNVGKWKWFKYSVKQLAIESGEKVSTEKSN